MKMVIHKTITKVTFRALFVVFFSSLFVFQVSPTKAEEPQAEMVWVLTETLVNPFEAKKNFIGGGAQPDWFSEARFEGTVVNYTVTETSFKIDDRFVDYGYEYHNITVETYFEKPPLKLIPGETINLIAGFTHSGTAEDVGGVARFWYDSKGVVMQPDYPFVYAPWAEGFDGSADVTYRFQVPSASSGGEIEIYASWWNAEPCLVVWKYQAQEVSGTAEEVLVPDPGEETTVDQDDETTNPDDTTTSTDDDLPEAGGPNSADDSGQDAVNPADTGGLNPMAPIIGIGVTSAVGAAAVAAVAGAAAVAISRGKNGGKRKKDKKDEKKKDPCVDDLNRLKEASTQARALHDGIQTLRSHLELLETQYENIRQAAYWNASVDLGLLGASIFGAPLTVGFTGRAVAEKTIGIAMRDSALTALGSELMKSVTNGLLEQGVSWESLVKAPYGGAEGVIIQNVITECLTQRYQTRLIQQGLPGAVRNSLVKGYPKQVASHIASGVMQFISLGKIAYGAYTEAEKLEAIREIMSGVRKSLFEMELLYEEALSEMRISRSVYEKCRKMWQL